MRHVPAASRHLGLLAMVALGLVATSCGGGSTEAPARPSAAPAVPAAAPAQLPSLSPMTNSAGEGSLAPRLSRRPDGGAILSWLQPTAGGVALQWAAVDSQGTSWPAAREVVASDKVLPNAADVPGVLSLGYGHLLAHWRETREPAGGGLDIRVKLSLDGGQSWEETVTPHRDGTNTEHGFLVAWDASQPLNGSAEGPKRRGADLAGGSGGDSAGSSAPGNGTATAVPNGDMPFEAGMAWLDGREAATSPQAFAAQMMATSLGSGGPVGLGVEQVLDARTCDCCPTVAARAGDVTLLAYRDRTEQDHRDIAVLRRPATNEWSQPIRVHEDSWQVMGCPVNGPALDAEGDRAVLAWYTASQDDPRVLLAFSADAGATWSEPIRVDENGGSSTAGQPAVVLLSDGSAVVAWLQRRDDSQVVLGRRVSATGSIGPVRELASSVTGITQMARANGRVLVAWTERVPAAAAVPETRRVVTAFWNTAELLR